MHTVSFQHKAVVCDEYTRAEITLAPEIWIKVIKETSSALGGIFGGMYFLRDFAALGQGHQFPEGDSF